MPTLESLVRGDVHLWPVRLDLNDDRRFALLSDLLSPFELEMASTIAESERSRYTVCRAYLRSILARYLASAPSDIEISSDTEGKPTLRDHRISFNVSHSGGLGIVAVSTGEKIGVDIERVRLIIGWERVAARFLSDVEIAELCASSEERRRVALAAHWVVNEALLKASGGGLTEGPRPADVRRFVVTRFMPAAGWIGALASEAHPRRIVWKREEMLLLSRT